MQKTTFRISKMDCASEEQLVRMRLEGIDGIVSLCFELDQKRLDVVHSADNDLILSRLNDLKLDTTLISSEQVFTDVGESSKALETRILWQVLLINFFFFVVELIAGFLANSMGLAADGLDMLADTFVYGLALYAVSGSTVRKKEIARISGYIQLLLAALGFTEVGRRFIGLEELPSFQVMVVISLMALIGNAGSLFLLQKSRSKEAHIRASLIFTSNDVIANIGVILAGILVLVTGSRLPDLLVGLTIFTLVARGAFRILQLSK